MESMDKEMKKDTPSARPTTLKEYRKKWSKDTPMIEISPQEGQAMAFFSGPDGKVDMIDAARQFCGVERDEGDIVIRVRDGKIIDEDIS